MSASAPLTRCKFEIFIEVSVHRETTFCFLAAVLVTGCFPGHQKTRHIIVVIGSHRISPVMGSCPALDQADSDSKIDVMKSYCTHDISRRLTRLFLILSLPLAFMDREDPHCRKLRGPAR